MEHQRRGSSVRRTLIPISGGRRPRSRSPRAAGARRALRAALGARGSAAPVTLTLWHNYGTEQNAVATQNLAAALRGEHPNVTFKVVSQPGDNYFALLQAAAVSKHRAGHRRDVDGLFTLKDKGFLAEPEGLVPGGRLKQVEQGARSGCPPGLNDASNSVRDAARGPVLHRLLQQGGLQEGRRRGGAADVGSAERRVHEASSRRLHPARLRQRRPVARHRVLPVVRPRAT